MRYLPLASSEDRALLDAIGVQKAEDLLIGVPEHLRLARPLNLPPTSSELEVLRDLEAMADLNTRFRTRFLGAGAYAHFLPTAIDHQISRQEWFTAYTPYQPEISQGTLQHIFEYQTLICDLTGLEVTNASLYDGGTACVEAALMAVRVAKKRRASSAICLKSGRPQVSRMTSSRSPCSPVAASVHLPAAPLPVCGPFSRTNIDRPGVLRTSPTCQYRPARWPDDR